MEIYQIAAVGLIAAVLSQVIKRENASVSVLIGLAASLIIFIFIIPKISAVMDIITEISAAVETGIPYVASIIKIIGISYIAEFSSQICNDAGESSIASKIELAAKILIMTITAPIVLALVNKVIMFLP